MQDKYANRAFLLYSCDTLVYNSNISVLCQEKQKYILTYSIPCFSLLRTQEPEYNSLFQGVFLDLKLLVHILQYLYSISIWLKLLCKYFFNRHSLYYQMFSSFFGLNIQLFDYFDCTVVITITLFMLIVIPYMFFDLALAHKYQ